MTSLAALLGGAALGIAAGFAQLELLRFGALAREQLPVFWGSFALAGAALGILIERLLARWSAGALLGRGLGAVLVTLLLALFVWLNRRDLPDVYLLITDTTRADHLSLYGYERQTTPFLERLAARSAVFDNSVSQGSHTIVSTPSILASRYPSEHGVSSYDDVLPKELKLVSEYLGEHGYRTYAHVTNPHLAPERGYSRGFDLYQHSAQWLHTPASDVNRKFLGWLDAREGSPRFAFLFYVDPHSPYRPPPPYRRRFDPDWEGSPVYRWPKDRDPESYPRALVNLIAQYDGSIAYFDAELEALVTELDARGAFSNAILIYTSDHGEEFFEHGNWGHNRTLFEESIRVPLVFSLPPPIHLPPLARVSRRIPQVVSSVDVLPTLLDYLQIPTDRRASGRSALPLILGFSLAEEGRSAYCEEILESYGPYDVRAIRTETHKYVRILEYEGRREPRDLFFDLASGRSEQDDLLTAQPELAALHRERLERALTEMARAEPPENATVPLGESGIEALRALGYLEDEP